MTNLSFTDGIHFYFGQALAGFLTTIGILALFGLLILIVMFYNWLHKR